MSKIINRKLDMTPGGVMLVIHMSQYDSDFTIVFSLYNSDGTFTIESGTTARIRGTKKSGTGYSVPATVDASTNTVTVTGDQQMTAVAGTNIYEITLYKNGKELNSANFILDVERAALDMDTIMDETVARELDNLEQFVEEAESAATRAEQAAASFATDTTLTISGKPADAKAVGDAIASEDKKALAAFATDIASGAVANFPDGADSIPMKDVLVHIEPVQEGSGDPSPENVRPITGWTECTISHSGADMTNPTTYSITFPSSAGTVYGGTLDVTTGQLVVDRKMVTFDGTENWAISNGGMRVFIDSKFNDAKSNTGKNSLVGMISNQFVEKPPNNTWIGGVQNIGISLDENNQFCVCKTGKKDMVVADWKTYLANNPLHVCYKLSSPITYTLTPQEITSLFGTNNLWADTGDSEVEYRADTKMYVDNKIAELQALVLENNGGN